MTIYDRPNKEVFASDAPPSEIRPFTAWMRGLGIAFDETNGFPEMASFNGLLQALSIYIKYLEQRGLAEWRNDLEYPLGAGVQVGLSWFKAKRQNLNKPPLTSQDDWELLVNASALSYVEPLYIEKNVIKIRDATISQKGVARFATNTEAQTGAKVSAAITPDQATMASFGFGQSWKDVTNERFSVQWWNGFTNTTGKPIIVTILFRGEAGITINNIQVDRQGQSDNMSRSVSAVVPAGAKYYLNLISANAGDLSYTKVLELR